MLEYPQEAGGFFLGSDRAFRLIDFHGGRRGSVVPEDGANCQSQSRCFIKAALVQVAPDGQSGSAVGSDLRRKFG